MHFVEEITLSTPDGEGLSAIQLKMENAGKLILASVTEQHRTHAEQLVTAVQQEIARRRLEAGCCFVNGFVKSDPRLPFGGIKESGYGRELSRHGIREFVNTKTVFVAGS